MSRFLKKNWKEILSIFAIIAGVFIFFSGPTCDSDFWWQIKYAQYMIANHTLIPDHTLYSWFPSDNKTIYCAWLAEIVMYLLYSAGSLPAVFFMRYVIFALAGFTLYIYSRGLQSRSKGAVIACITSMFWLLSPSIAVRPTLFSVFFFILYVWIYFTVKRDCSKYRLFYLFPVIMILWVNSHGIFVFGGVFLFIVFVGDLLNARFGSANILDKRALSHLFIASAATGLSFLVTPYGWNYPLNLYTEIFGNASYMQFQNESVSEFHSFYAANPNLFIVSVLWSILIYIVFFISYRKKKFDLSYFILFTSFLGMGAYYYRLTFIFAIIAGFISIYLAAEICDDLLSRMWVTAVFTGYSVLFLFLYFGNSIYYPYIQGDLFNTDLRTQCAVEEAEFIKKLGFKKIGNDPNIGSYLIWMLGPEAKVMMDPRWFPYKEELPAFFKTYVDPVKFAGYALHQDCDAWIFSYSYARPISYLFSNITDWKVGFYGQFGMVFVRSSYPTLPGKMRMGDFRDIHNMPGAGSVLMVACDLNDWEGAEDALYSIEHNFNRNTYGSTMRFYRSYYTGRKALFEKDYNTAAVELERCGSGIPQGLFLFAAQMNALELWNKGDDVSAYKWISNALKANYKDSINLYNSGAAGWWLAKQIRDGKIKDAAVDNTWKENLTSFLERESNNPGTVPTQQICRQILEGSYQQKPVLLYPEMPRVLSQISVDK